jgi:hypothetical protein
MLISFLEEPHQAGIQLDDLLDDLLAGRLLSCASARRWVNQAVCVAGVGEACGMCEGDEGGQ